MSKKRLSVLLSLCTVMLMTPFCEGFPVKGSMMCLYRVPS